MISTRRFRRIAVFGWLAATWPAYAASLLDAVNAARGFDAGIAAAREARLAGHEKRWQGLAGLLPRAQIDGHYTKQDQPTATYAAAVRRHGASATITQPIFDMARIADFKRGGALADQADIEYERAEQTLITEVSNAYFDVLYARDVLQAADAAQQAFQRQFDQAYALLRIGDGTRMDVDEARANLDDALARKVGAQTDLEIASGTLRRLTGLPADGIAPIAWQCVQAEAPVDLPTAMEEAARDGIDVRLAEKQLEQSRVDIIAATGSNLPVVNLQGSYGTNWSRGAGENMLDNIFGTTSKTRTSTIGVTVAIPLFAGGGPLSASREAYRRRNQARDALEDARRKRANARAAHISASPTVSR